MVRHGIMPRVAVWAALVNVCGHNLDVTRDEFAAEHLLQLEPNKPWEGGILTQSFKYRC